MRSPNIIIFCVILCLSFVTVQAFGADVAKIGIVDFQRILKETKAGKRVAKELRKKQEERVSYLKKRRAEIVELKKNMESIELTGSKDDREEKKIELNAKLEAFAEAENKFNTELKEINNKHSEIIKMNSASIIEKIGKKGGYLLILEKTDVLYSPSSTDITSRIITQYDKTYGDGK